MTVQSAYSRFDRLLALRDRLAALLARRPRTRTARLTAEVLEDRLVPDGGRPLPLPTIFMGSGGGLNSSPIVQAYNAETGVLSFERAAYEPTFTGGVRVAAGDLTRDGFPDVIVAPGPGGGPRVRVLDGKTGEPIPGPLGSFWAFDPSFTGGVNVASADVDGDGTPDVVAAAGAGGGPHVTVFSGATGAVLASFFALDPDFGGGLSVAAADLTGDGRAEIAVGAGEGGASHVRVLDPTTWAPVAGPLGSFFAFDPAFRGGVFASADSLAGDVDGDGTPDLAVGSGPGMAGRVVVYSGATGAVLKDFQPFGPERSGGIRVALAYVDDDDRADVITGTGPGGPAAVRVFSGATGAQLPPPVGEYTPFGTGAASLGGVFVAASNDPPVPNVHDTVMHTFDNIVRIEEGELIKMSVTVERTDPGDPTPTGTVGFYVTKQFDLDSTYNPGPEFVVATATLVEVSPGVAVAKTDAFQAHLPRGQYYWRAAYAGDAYYDPTSSAPDGFNVYPPIRVAPLCPAGPAFGGGPGGNEPAGRAEGGVQLSDGSVRLTSSALPSGGFGEGWGYAWSWSSDADPGSAEPRPRPSPGSSGTAGRTTRSTAPPRSTRSTTSTACSTPGGANGPGSPGATPPGS